MIAFAMTGGANDVKQILDEARTQRAQLVKEGKTYAQQHAAEFCEEHRGSLDALIGLYADADALDLLESMREAFWARTWKPKEQR